MRLRTPLLALVAVLAVPGAAQTKADLPAEREAHRASERVERSAVRSGRANASVAGPLSFRTFTRGNLATGNLMQVPYVTNLNVSAGYYGGTVQPNQVQWPGSSGVEYGHTMSLIVGAQVQNDAGRSLTILSESYNRSGGDAAPNGSHKYQFNALPGGYNMQGDRATRNQLNANAEDRAVLDAQGYYFVGGLGEDLNGNGRLDPREDVNGNGQLDGELTNLLQFSAQSNLRETWPAFWTPQSYPGDDRPACPFVQGTTCRPGPGVRAGRWNGAYGAFVRADQEGYYRADDRDNDEFPYYPFLDPATGQPDTRGWAEGGRRGLGVEVTARQYQWASVLAEDIFIATFDIENVSRKDIEHAIVAMIVDYDIGGQTSNNEALFDTEDDITYQWNRRDLVRNGFRVGYGGVGFLESPGLDRDGVDNDADGLTDESRSNGIDDDGDWRRWEDVDGDGQFDNEDANRNNRLDPGEDADGDGRLTVEPAFDDVGSDGLGPRNEGYPGPDPDGTETNGRPDLGEPNFEFTDNDEIDQIGLTGMVIRTPAEFDRDLDDDAVFWDDYLQPGTFVVPTETADIIYVYASGVTDIRRGQRQRFSIAFFCGNNFQDMLRNKRTIQAIYDADYNFAKPPRTPFLIAATPGDERVTLVWDASAEDSVDPIYGFDFEMYKVYRSTDPAFNEIKTITDAFGNPLLWETLKDETGNDVQFDLQNGLSGAHPVPVGDLGVSYDMGTDSGLRYSHVDSTVTNGRTYYYAVVAVDQGYDVDFFERGISALDALTPISPTESSKDIQVDALGRVTFVDQNTAVVVPQPPATDYVEPTVTATERSGNADGGLTAQFLVPGRVAAGTTYEVTFTDDGRYESLDPAFFEGGLTTGFVLRNATTGDTLATARGGPAALFQSPALTAGLYGGVRFALDGATAPTVDRLDVLPAGGRAAPARYRVTASAPTNAEQGGPVPRDYELRVGELGVDTTNSLGVTSRIPVNASLFDVTSRDAPRRVPIQLTEGAPQIPSDTLAGVLSPGDRLAVRFLGVEIGGYTFYAKSAWTFEVALSPAGAAFMAAARTRSPALYDVLVANAVRGFETRPYGPALDVPEYDDFYREVGAWYDAELGALGQIAAFQTLAASPDYAPPSVMLDAFARLETTEMPRPGDVVVLETAKPFDRDDVLRLTVGGNTVAEGVSADVLDAIVVVPDPYVAVNGLETFSPQLGGRGERRIDFRNLPRRATIRIYTLSGRRVKVIEHDAFQDRSFASWNLQSDDGLDVAFGVYVYHVEAPGIGETVGRFALIR